MSHTARLLLAAIYWLIVSPTFAYQVWEGMHCTPGAAATNLAAWAETAGRVEGLNQNTAPYGGSFTNPGAATRSQWQTIFQQYTNASFSYCEIDRIQISSNTASFFGSMTNRVEQQFQTGANDGFTVQNIMFYDDVVPYLWTTSEVQQMRDYLDGTGRTNVGLLYDVRNFSVACQNWIKNPLVDNIVIEANANTWLNNVNNNWALLQFIWTNPASLNKKIIFQVPRSNNAQTQFQATREVVAMLTTNAAAGFDIIRSPRIVFLVCNYSSAPFFPETAAPNLYTNTLTGLCLSLLEQRAYFEGRTGVIPTWSAADSYLRSPAPTIGTVMSQTTSNGVTSAPISFTVGSPAFPAAAITVTAASPSAHLVASTNIVIRAWADTDLGSVTPAGSSTPGDAITINASGADISRTADAGHFLGQPLPGDGAMSARVLSLQPVNAASKAGVMMRASTNAGSVNCYMHLTASNGVEFTWRQLNNGATSNSVIAGVTAPCWLNLVKAGTNFTGYYAPDNAGSPGTWVQVGPTVGIGSMGSNLLSGLAGTSHNNGVLCAAVYDNVSGNSNRSVTITPTMNQSGIATISLIASDGWFTTTNTFNLIVPTPGANTPPSLGNLTNSLTLIESSTATIPFTVSDAQSAADSLFVTGFSSNANLVSNASLVFGGTISNRTLTVTPAPLKTGNATIGVVVSDGTLSSTNTLALSVISFKPPFITNLAATVTMNENGTTLVPFTVGDVQVPANSLQVSGYSSNPGLISDANLVFGGSGSNRTVTLSPTDYQTGTATINLIVDDGVLTATNSFLLTVVPSANFHTAVASGDINDPNTWGGVVPVAGDTNLWQTGTNTVNMSANSTATFNGKTFVIQTGGQFSPGVPGATLTLNNLVLAGGSISMPNNSGLVMNLSGKTFTLNAGRLLTGSASTGLKTISFKNGLLAGSGTIDVTGANMYTNGNYVEFQSTINPTNFTGILSVHDNGVLNLSAITLANASFGLSLSDTGTYYNDANVALTSLTINGADVAPGSYRYTNFPPAQQSFLLNSSGILTVVTVKPTTPTLAPIADQTLIAGQTLMLTNVATDADYPAPTLTFSLVGSQHGLDSIPPAMTLNPANGILFWRPAIADSAAGTITLGVQVSNNGNPPLMAEQDFNITVNPPTAPALANIGWSKGKFTFTVSGDSGPDYIMQVSTNLLNWSPLGTNYSPQLPFGYTNATANFNRRFYRVLLGP